MNSQCDILIVGGGPSGALAARLLAQAGRSVTLIEAQPVLGERICGAYLCPAGVALLDELDLRAAVTGGMRSLLGMMLVAPDERRLQTRFPANSRFPDFGISLLRPQFDNAMLAAAAQAGATIRMGTRMQTLHRAGDSWCVELSSGEKIFARLLVGADGRKSRVAKLLKLTTTPWQQRVALHVDVPSLTPTEPYGEMHVFNDGTYIGLNPIGTHTLNVSALCDPHELHHATAMAFLNQRTQASAQLRHRIAPLTEVAKVRATFPAAQNVRDVITTNAALIGDASGFFDPLTGEGIYQALWTARALAEQVSAVWGEKPDSQADRFAINPPLTPPGRGTLLRARSEILPSWEGPGVGVPTTIDSSFPQAAISAALRRYSRQRRQQHRGKRLCCQAFQAIIRRPRLSNAVHRMLSFRAGIGNAFIGLIGNNYTPAQAAWNMVKALA